MLRTRTLSAVLLLAGSLAAQASGLRVTPLRLDLSARQTTTQVELANLGPAGVPVQISAFAWTQENGSDVYTPTKDIFFAPPIVSVPANGKSLVRFRLRGAAPKTGERAYRVYFQEVAAPQAQAQTGMSFRLRFGVPVFVSASKPGGAKLGVEWSRESDALRLVLTNTGSAHLKIEGLELYSGDIDREKLGAEPVARTTHSSAGANYLLPGSRHDWAIPLAAAQALEQHVLLIRTDDYSGRVAQGATPRGWVWQEFPPAR